MALGFLAALVGMICFASTQTKHARTWLKRPLSLLQRRFVLLGAWLLLLISAGLSVLEYGIGIGLTTFLAWLCFAGWAVALTISWRKSRHKKR